MTASDWAAWIGAVTGVLALVWEVVRWSREGPRLLVRAASNIRIMPDPEGRTFLAVYVTNTGSVPVTLTTCAMLTFSSTLRRWRLRPARSWVSITNSLGPELPRELHPGQQWTCGIKQNHELEELVAGGRLYVAIYHAARPRRPSLVHVPPIKPVVANEPTES